MKIRKSSEIFVVLTLIVLAVGAGQVVAATYTVDDDGPSDFDTIQTAINNVAGGDVIKVKEGLYEETLDLQAKPLTLDGEGVGKTTIDTSSDAGYAISNFGNNTTFKDVTLIGTETPKYGYGFKISHVSNVTLKNIRVESSQKTGIDLHTVRGATLKNIEVVDTESGFGLMIFESSDVDVKNIKTRGNAWGGVTVQLKNNNVGPVSFGGSFEAGEAVPFLLEQDPPYDGEFVDVEIPQKFNYVSYGRRSVDGYKQWFYKETLSEARSITASILSSHAKVFISDVSEDNFYVLPQMVVRHAVEKANSGASVKLFEGTHEEDIDINTANLTLTSEGDKEDTVINGRILVTAPNVTIKGLTVTNPNGGPESFVGVKVANGIQTKNGSDSSGLVVRNNTIENIGTALTDTTLSDGAGILLFDTNDVLVEDNIIKGVRGGVEPDPYRSAKGIHIGDSNHGSSDITIKDNDISDIKNFGESHDAHGVLIYTGDTSGIKILDNSISDIVGSAGDGVSLGGVASDVRIKGNTFEDMKSYRRTDDEAGIAIGFWGGTPSTFEVHKNNLLTEIGVANWVPGTTIDATRNYWGEEFGPPGKGKGLDSKGPKEKVEGGVEFHPWLPNPVGKPEKPGVVNPGPPSNKGPRVESFSVTPNPTRSNQQVTFKAQGSAVNQVRVKVFNSVGLQVYDSNFQAGSTVTWNLVGKSGERLANGLYLFTLSAKVDGDLQRSGVRRLLVIN